MARGANLSALVVGYQTFKLRPVAVLPTVAHGLKNDDALGERAQQLSGLWTTVFDKCDEDKAARDAAQYLARCPGAAPTPAAGADASTRRAPCDLSISGKGCDNVLPDAGSAGRHLCENDFRLG